jgi:hypothetical protein
VSSVEGVARAEISFPRKEVGDTGLEQGVESSRKIAISETRGADSGALGARTRLDVAHGVGVSGDDHGLRVVVEAWPALPDAVKAGILAMVRTCRA